MPRPSFSIEKCAIGDEALFVDEEGRVSVNLHNHTDRSDGRDPMHVLAGYAEKHGVNLAVTDHNDVPEPKGGRMPAGLIAGLEVFTRENVDVVVVPWDLNEAHALYGELVRPHLHPRNPRFRPTSLPIRTLLEATRGRAHCIHPHYATTEGMSRLPTEWQAEILTISRDHAFMERNALLWKGQNDLAGRVARTWDMPIVSTGDTHCGEAQHVGTFSSVPRSALARESGTIVRRLMEALRDPSHTREQMMPIGTRETALTLAQIIRKNGVVPIAAVVWDGLRRALQLLPRAHADNIPAPLRGSREVRT